MKKSFHLFITSITLLFGLTTHIIEVQAKTATYRLLERDKATNSVTQVQVVPGRATPISFSPANETITHILLADPSRLVYTTDKRATTIFIKVIQPLNFTGNTTNSITNLLVQTIDKEGQLRLYNFEILQKRSRANYIGIQIIPTVAGQQRILIDKNRQATVDDIETGLRIALQRGYTTKNDPVVSKVQQLLATLRTNNITIPEAAKSIGLPLEVISALGKTALNERLLRPTEYLPINDK
jgi:hypothetical protein